MGVTRADGKTQIFLNSKCERNHALKRNPRKINWTVLYRRKHRKGMVEEAAKKRTRRTQKSGRLKGSKPCARLRKRNRPKSRRRKRNSKLPRPQKWRNQPSQRRPK